MKNKDLKVLDLSFKGLEKIPEEVFDNVHLRELYLFNNEIMELPESIGKLTQLEVLDLANNGLEILPDAICRLKSLNRLNLQNNTISRLPECIKELTKLNSNANKRSYEKGLVLDGNDFRLPESVYELDPKHLIRNILDRQLGPTRPIAAAKIIFIGDSGNGKTSLIQKLLNPNLEPDPSTTLGVDITNWAVSYEGKEAKVGIWDFGGQEIMHSTHQFFLTDRTVYVLTGLARTEGDDENLRYWLRLISKLCGDSPILICINKIDKEEEPNYINRKAIQKAFPNVKGFVRTSTKEGREDTIKELERKLSKLITGLKHVFDEFPSDWFRIKAKLEDMEKGYISYNDYKKLVDQTIPGFDDERKESTIRLLTSLGIVIFYPDHPRLRDVGILKPQWVTNAVYAIINDSKTKENQGRFSENDFDRILAKKGILKEYPETKRNFIIDLMVNFELCFPMENNMYLIPTLSSYDEIKHDFDIKTSLKVRLNYNFSPRSVVTRFIVKLHNIIKDNYVWRDGVILKKGTSEAKIAIAYDTNHIVIELKENADINERKLLLHGILKNISDVNDQMLKGGNAGINQELFLKTNGLIGKCWRMLMKWGKKTLLIIN